MKPPPTPSAAAPLPAATREYFEQAPLRPVWDAARARLERNGLEITRGPVWVELDEDGRTLLGGVLGGTVIWQVNRGTQIRLDALDESLRRSAANCGLLAVLTALGGPVTDRRAAHAARSRKSADLWGHVDAELTRAGLAGAPWARGWLTEVRRSGLLTRAGDAATATATEACCVLAVLAEHLPLSADPVVLSAALPAVPRFELAELASRCTSSAHGLDAGTATGALVLRALALATGQPAAGSAAERRLLWDTFGVAPDHVSGTVLLWAVRPPGAGPWASMMTARADLGLVTHVTMQEWQQAASTEPWVSARGVVHVCENPQVLQAAARARIDAPLLCLSGNPATVGTAVVDALVRAGAVVRYHGDFDVDGIKIAGRVMARGAKPWRLGAVDYEHALTVTSRGEQLAITGTVPAVPWDPDLAADMNRAKVGVHEEALLEVLLADMQAHSAART